MNKSESKYFNTAVKMDEAFLSLLGEKDFDFITVKEICARSGVNRSTFYLHYENVGDLLLETMEYINGKFYSYFTHLNMDFSTVQCATKDALNLITPKFLTPWLSFIRENRILYSTALTKFDTLQMGGEIYESIFQTIHIALERYGVPTKQRGYMMMFYLNGMTVIVQEWLRGNCEDSIDDIVAVILECVRPL